VLRVAALSLGLFVAAPRHNDVQSPHSVDEIYVVVAGRAVLEVDGVRTPVETGSGRARASARPTGQSVDVTEELRVIVIFAPPGPD
jgi:mannose-6-phosphate isomerase-like protein (cupin superfamily)